MSEITSIIDRERDNIKSLMLEKKRKQIQKILLPILNLVNESNKTEFYNFLGELLAYTSDFFEDYIYYPLLSKNRKRFTDERLIEMESYLLNKLCLNPKEEILAAFTGETQIRDDSIVGRMYLTNVRVIGIGSLIERKKQSYSRSGGLIGAVVRGAVGANREIKRQRIRNAIKQLMGEGDFLFFGHQIPINGAFNIKKSSGYFQFYINLEEQKKKKVKTVQVKVKITPKKMKNEPSNDFKNRRIDILNKIGNVVSSLQS